MKQKTTDKKRVIVAFFFLLVISLLVDISKESIIKEGRIEREDIGGDEKEIQLQINIGDILEDYDYTLTIPPIQPTKEEAETLFQKAIEIIEKDFENIDGKIPVCSAYLDNVVKATWSFSPFNVIDSEGNICDEELSPGGETIQAEVHLSCGEYEKLFRFGFQLFPRELTQEEACIKLLEEHLQKQKESEGTAWLELPARLGEYDIAWSEKKDYVTPQVLLLEIVALILFEVMSKRKRTRDEKKKISDMEKAYPDIVNQLSLLLGAGMTTRQAWNRMTAQYIFKRKNGLTEENMIYEAILRMNRRFSEGETERRVYQQFSQEIAAPCYHKLMRILIGSLEKGTQGICIRLEEESRFAYEQRITQAKKQGEEASTKMLLPLMLMMMVVMGIVMLPALMEFQI